MGSASVSAPRVVAGEANDVSEIESIAELYRRFGRRVHARCKRLLCEEQTAEDATQEIFLKLLLRPTALTPAEATWSFLRRVATNHCLNQLRNESRRREARLALDTWAPSTSDRVADRQLVARILTSVPAELTVIGWMNHVDELDQRDIAERLSISRRTVVSRLSSFNTRAKRMLLRSLSSRGALPLAGGIDRDHCDLGLSAHEEG